MTLLKLASWMLVGIVAPACLYLAALALLARRARAPAAGATSLRFDIVVPAHNEEHGIEETVRGLLRVEYPPHLFRVVVVADNCRDATAAKAKSAGANVLVREDPHHRGKGYALEHAFSVLLLEGHADAFVVVDADTQVSKNMLSSFAARLEQGQHALQAEYGVSNVDANWRTRLMAIALAALHGVRSSARERLGLSVGLRGNGMCFSRALLLSHPHRAHGLVEDVEFGVQLGLDGVRVAFASDVVAVSEMPVTGEAAASQRRRWEGGRFELLRARALRILKEGVRRRSWVILDLALDLLVPPIGYLGLIIVGGVALELASIFLEKGVTLALAAWLSCAGLLGLYVVRGTLWSGVGTRGVLALTWAPIFVLWKLLCVRPWHPDATWIRTRRVRERVNPA